MSSFVPFPELPQAGVYPSLGPCICERDEAEFGGRLTLQRLLSFVVKATIGMFNISSENDDISYDIKVIYLRAQPDVL